MGWTIALNSSKFLYGRRRFDFNVESSGYFSIRISLIYIYSGSSHPYFIVRCCQRIIFSIGKTSMPSAPRDFNCPIISQKHFSSRTVWILLQPSVANGMMVGLFTPGRMLVISFTLLVGAFIRTYFLSLHTPRYVCNVSWRKNDRPVGVSLLFRHEDRRTFF